MADKNKIKVSAFDGYDDLNMEMATFADGSRIIPRIAVQQGKKYVSWKDNGSSINTDYPLKILELYNNSSLHHSIIDMKAEQIAGAGLEVVDPDAPNAQATIDFIEKMNRNDIDCNETNKRLALDLTLFNGFTPELNYTKDWGKIDTVVHLELNKIRVHSPDEKGEIHGYFWAFDWSLYRPSRLRFYEPYNRNTATLNKVEYDEINARIMEENHNPNDVNELTTFLERGNTQLFYNQVYTPNSFYYPIPDYIAVIPSVEIDILSDNYATSSLANGMDIGLTITLFGDLDDNELKKTAKRLIKSHGGSRRAGKPFIVVAESPETAPKIESIASNDNLAQKYKIINDSTQQKILSGHRIPNSSIVGIQTAGKLGNSSDSTNAEEIFFNKYIHPRQMILEKFWNMVMKYNGLAKVRIINNNVFNENRIESEENNIIDTNKE